MESGGDSSVKEVMQKFSANFEDKWGVNANKKHEEEWDSSINNVATKFKDAWDVHRSKKSITAPDKATPVGDAVGAKSGRANNTAQTEEQRNVDKDSNNAKKQAMGAKKSSAAAGESSNRTFGSPLPDNPYVMSPISCSRSGLEE